MVAYGYDEGGVHFSDPARGDYGFYDWDTIYWMWSALDGMALSVSWM